LAAYLAAIVASLLCSPALGLLLAERAHLPLLFAVTVGFYAALPALIVISIGEFASLRSPLLYGGAGVVISVATYLGLALQQRLGVEFLSGRFGAVAIGFFAVCGLA